MRHKRFWMAGLIVALVLALLPAGAQATPPIGGDTISFGAGNDVGASADWVRSVAVGDLDNDGDLDIVTGSVSGEDYEVIAWQNGGTPFSGTWTQNDVGATEAVQSVALGDLDGDGDLDIVSGNSAGVITVWQNDGDPFSGTWTSNQVGDHAWQACIALGDLDKDGDLDIVSGTSSVEDFELAVWQNDGTPFSDAWVQNDVGASTATVWSVALGDLDEDGDLDLVSAGDSGEDNEVIAWNNDGTPFSELWTQNDVGASAGTVWSVALGDLDDDGDLDLVSGSSWEETPEVLAWQNDGTPFSGLWTRNEAGPAGDTVYSVAVGDLDDDGDLDVVSGNDAATGTEVSGWQNDGTPFSGAWIDREVGHSDSNVRSVALGDLDGDGDLDAVTGSESGEDYEVIACPNTLVHRNMPYDPAGNGVGASAGNVLAVALGDLDDDGDLDAVSGSNTDEDNEVIAWRNGGTPFSGTWTQNDVGASAGTVRSVAVGDLDNDGDLDIVTGSTSGEDFEVIAWQNGGSPFSGTWTQNDVGASSASVYSVALGDVDGDGDLDVVSGSGTGEDFEVIAWQNDGSPFGGTWAPNNVGASADTVRSVALGDLDGDGDLDLISGSGLAEDYEVIAWQNDGSPFSGTWAQNDVGASTGFVTSVALGDLDEDGDLDIASASSASEDREVITWQNDGTPFSGLWTQGDVGATDLVQSVALGDLDDDGDLDLVSGSNTGAAYEVMAWHNAGGSAAEDTTATAPAGIGDGQADDLLRIVAAHNGISGDNDLELAQWNLFFEEIGGGPVTSTEINNLIENLYVYYSTDGTWEPADTVVITLPDLALSCGVQTIQFADGDGDVQVPPLTSKTYFVVAEIAANASAQTPDAFRITFDPDAGSLVEDRVEDSSVSIEDSGPVTVEVTTFSTSPLTTTVNSTNDVDDGTCDVAHCSLREAVHAANSNPGPDTIAFHITSGCAAGGVCTIQPTSALPALTDDGATVDGYTQPGAAQATDTTPAVLKIEIDGTLAGAASGFRLDSSNNSISGLVVNRFSQHGISISGSGVTGNTVSGNFIGTDASGAASLGNSASGVAIRGGAQNNTIGGGTAGERNVISGNGEAGVWIYDSSTASNTVSGNYIGTDADGTAALSNTGDGVAIGGGAQNNTVGPDNVIAHNDDGVEVYESSTAGNTITLNSIFSNTMGINLSSSANGRIVAPVIVTTTLGSLDVIGTACPGCTVEVFENSDTDGEGETYVGSTTATAGGAFTVTASSLSKPYLTATATEVVSGTSEFSAVFTATVTGPAPVYLPVVLRSF